MLDSVLGKLARQQDDNVLVGFDKSDDAGVYLLTPELAVVQTVDFFTPIADDPYTYGQIAATNALSDVYAMGGVPRTALTMVCFPEKEDVSVLEQVLAGGLSKMIEAGCTVIGGHSIRDKEMKFGYAVTGTIDPRRILTNSGARVGDSLVLTKALGTGVVSTAVKAGKAEEAWLQAALKAMTTLNRTASEVCLKYEVHSMTDVTGFGLMGHAREMALGSGVGMVLHASRIPALPGAMECIAQKFIPGGLRSNRDFAGCAVEFDAAIAEDRQMLMFDPQTAGGLLVSVRGDQAQAMVEELRAAGVAADVIGDVVERVSPPIHVVE